jgi:hypothetical protein
MNVVNCAFHQMNTVNVNSMIINSGIGKLVPCAVTKYLWFIE